MRTPVGKSKQPATPNAASSPKLCPIKMPGTPPASLSYISAQDILYMDRELGQIGGFRHSGRTGSDPATDDSMGIPTDEFVSNGRGFGKFSSGPPGPPSRMRQHGY